MVVVCRKGSETIEERNEELKMACMPREGREPRGGEEETGEIDRVAAAPEPLSLEEWWENKGRALKLNCWSEHNNTLVYPTINRNSGQHTHGKANHNGWFLFVIFKIAASKKHK